MEINEAYKLIEKHLDSVNKELGFSRIRDREEPAFKSEKGLYRLVYDQKTHILSLECAYEDTGDEEQYKTVSKSLFEPESSDERDCRYTANEIGDEVKSLFAVRKKVDLEKVKMPKAVSRGQAKSGSISYDTDSLANRFGVLYPDLKDDIKRNIVEYGEFLPETFFQDIGAPRVLEVMRNGSQSEQKKLFKMLCDVYEDGTNEVQDIIGVTILGEMKNDPKLMAIADKYMSEYMAGPIHEINKITAKKNKYTKKLKNPPPYKPKKKKTGVLQNALNQAGE